MAEFPSPRSRALHRFAVVTAAATLFLIVAGGLVTSTESGLSVPDWPLSYGRLMPPMVGGVFYEHGHRMVATTVGLATIVLAIWLSRREPRAWVRRLGWLALAAIVAQGLLGGLTVLFLLPTPISVAHACLAQAFFGLVVAIAVVTAPRWSRRSGAQPVTKLAVLTASAVFLQLAIGAVMRHTKSGLAIPDFPLSLGRVVPPLDAFPVAIAFAHRVGALVVAVGAFAAAAAAWRTGGAALRLTGAGLAALVVAQIALGAMTVLSGRAVPLATAHVAAGALLFATSVALAIGSLANEPVPAGGIEASVRRARAERREPVTAT